MRFYGLLLGILCLMACTTHKQQRRNLQKIKAEIYGSLSATEVFPKQHYGRVVSYAFNADSTKSIVNDGQIATSAIEDSTEMSFSQINEFIAIINDTTSYQGEGFRCFIPRWGIVFYDTKNEPIAYTNICFTCNNIDAYPAIEGENFSRIGRQKLESMCSALELKYCEK